MTTAAALLPGTLVALAVCSIALVVVTVQARVLRARRDRSLAAVHGRYRHLLLEVASGEDDEGAARAELVAVTPRQWHHLRSAVVTLLSKVRGQPAASLAALLDAHGDLDRARADLKSVRAGQRARAAYLLGLARDSVCVPDLRAMLTDSSSDVRIVCARSLGLIGDPEAAADILAAAGTLPGAIRGRVGLPAWVAAEALLRIGPGAQQAVAQAIGSRDPYTRSVAALVARHGALPVAVPLARTCVHFETEEGTKETLLGVLGAMGDPEDDALLVAYTHPLAPVRLRRAAVEALGDLATEQSLACLGGLLGDDDRSVATAAGDALARGGGPGWAVLSAAEGRGRRVAAAALHLARLRQDVGSGP